MSFLPRRPYRSAWFVAVLASGLAIVAATLPNIGGRYDPLLAILTVTLVAIIWYTYFTYQSVNRFDPTFLHVSLGGMLHPTAIDLHPAIENRSANDVTARIILELWIGDSLHEQDDFYAGRDELIVEPLGSFVGAIRIDRTRLPPGRYDDMTGEPLEPVYDEVRARMTIFWKDHLGETGCAGPKYYYARLTDAPALGPVIAPQRIQDLFAELPPAAIEPPSGWKALGSTRSVSA